MENGDDNKVTALEWIINHLKLLQSNIININNIVNALISPMEYTFEFTFASDYAPSNEAGSNKYFSNLNYAYIPPVNGDITQTPRYFMVTDPVSHGSIYGCTLDLALNVCAYQTINETTASDIRSLLNDPGNRLQSIRLVRTDNSTVVFTTNNIAYNSDTLHARSGTISHFTNGDVSGVYIATLSHKLGYFFPFFAPLAVPSQSIYVLGKTCKLTISYLHLPQ